VDTEGHDGFVLVGARRSLEAGRIGVIIAEVSDKMNVFTWAALNGRPPVDLETYYAQADVTFKGMVSGDGVVSRGGIDCQSHYKPQWGIDR
jgi:hypothetical protein